jgi:hypothetical protein
MKKLLRILNEYRFIKTVNVVYQFQNVDDRRETKYQDGETIWVDRCFSMDVPQTGHAIIYDGYYFRVATIWHNKDANCIEIDLTDL